CVLPLSVCTPSVSCRSSLGSRGAPDLQANRDCNPPLPAKYGDLMSSIPNFDTVSKASDYRTNGTATLRCVALVLPAIVTLVLALTFRQGMRATDDLGYAALATSAIGGHPIPDR